MALVILTIPVPANGNSVVVQLPDEPIVGTDPELYRFLGVQRVSGRQQASGNAYECYFTYDDGSALVSRTLQQAPISQFSTSGKLEKVLTVFRPDGSDEPMVLNLR